MISWEFIKKHKLGIPLLWDLVMLFIVLGNLMLILFDLSYLWLRPLYLKNFPRILSIYDEPILGIEPHRVTESYTNFIDDLVYLTKIRDGEFRENQRKTTREEIFKVLQGLKGSTSNEKFDNLFKDFEVGLKIEDPEQRQKHLESTLVQLNDVFSVLEETDEINSLVLLSEKYSFINRLSQSGREAAELQKILIGMDKKMLEIVETNPFAMSGQTANFSRMQEVIKLEYQTHKTKARDIKYRQDLDAYLNRDRIPSTVVAFSWFWRDKERSLEDKILFFNTNLKLYFDLNYYRAIGADGKPVNHYLLLDAPFLTFFIFEFGFSWLLAIRKKTYIAWFLYPVYHWYDVLGLIPIVEFRFFRLIRVYKIYLMLQTNQFTKILGNDLISRSIRYYSNIIKEEISDLVTLQILTEAQNEVRSGNSLDQLVRAIDQNRVELKKVVLKNLAKSAQNQNLKGLIENLVGEISDHVSSNLKPILFIPKGLQATIGKQVSSAIYETVSKSVVAMANDPMGRMSVEKFIDFLIDEMILFAQDPDMIKLNTNITVALIENMKNAISEKKWLRASIGSS